jgi:hypothetical protein
LASAKALGSGRVDSPIYQLGGALLVVVVVLVIVRFAAAPIRRELMIEEPAWAPAANHEAPDAREESDRFFSQRDSVLIRVPSNMTVGEFIRLYHLRNTRGVHDALRAQLGVFQDSDPIRKDAEIRLHLTVPSQ